MMKRDEFLRIQERYRDALLKDCIPFWLKKGMDAEYGGMCTYLDREGKRYVSDKSVWLNGRAAWVFALLCETYGERADWKAAAYSCLDFLNQYCIDPADGRMYFSVTREGKPLRKRRYFFSETFYTIANAQSYRSFGDLQALGTARKYYDFLLAMYDDPAADPFKITPKVYAETRSGRAFARPMILLNVTHEMHRCDPERAELYESRGGSLTSDIFRYFYKEDFGVFLESVGPNGEFLADAAGGRTINPGHTIEGVWFLLNQAKLSGDAGLVRKAASIFDRATELGWDERYGGILAFIDALNFPPEQLEHDMKLWWPMTETLISAVMLYEMTGETKYWEWFVKADAYSFERFADPAYGEWFGYLRRDGTPTDPPCKGNLFKGCFHVPRALLLVDACLGRLVDRAAQGYHLAERVSYQ